MSRAHARLPADAVLFRFERMTAAGGRDEDYDAKALHMPAGRALDMAAEAWIEHDENYHMDYPVARGDEVVFVRVTNTASGESALFEISGEWVPDYHAVEHFAAEVEKAAR